MVLMTNCLLCGPLLRSGIDAPFGKVQVAPVGRPELQDSATVSGIAPVGVTVTVKVVAVPARMGGEVAGATAALKSFTVTDGAETETLTVEPVTLAVALFGSVTGPGLGVVGAVGVRTMVTVAVAPAFRVPMLHSTSPLTTEPQLPGLAVAETKVVGGAGGGSSTVSLKVTPVVRSPVLVIVYLKVTWLPMPTVVGVAVGGV